MSEPGVGRRAHLALLLAAAVLLLAGLGRVDAWAPDEPRYLQVAEEMRALPQGAASAVVPHLNGRPYDQKPPLYFWLAALAGAPAGRVSEAAARLPSALAGVALVALTLALGTRLLGGRTGLLGAGILLTTFEFAHLARRVQLDVLLALLETAALALFWRVDRGIGRRAPQVAALHACLGLAVLTKGPVGFLVPVLAMAVYLAWERRPRDLARSLPLWALPLSLGPGLAWLAAAASFSEGGFAAGAVGENLIGRFFAGTSHERPFYYYLYQLPLDFLPWTLLAPAIFLVARRASSRRRPRRPIGPPSAAPIFPTPLPRKPPSRCTASADTRRCSARGASCSRSSGRASSSSRCRAASAGSTCCRRSRRSRSSPPTRSCASSPGAGVCRARSASARRRRGGARPRARRRRTRRRALRRLVRARPPDLRLVDPVGVAAFGGATVAVAVLAIAAWIVLRRNGVAALRRMPIAVAAAWAVLLAAFQLLYPALDDRRSPRPIALAAAAVTPEGTPIGLVSDRAMVGGLLYYGGRRVAALRSPESIRAFLDAGGRTFVVKQRKLERVTAHVPVTEANRSRAGRRAVLVVVAGDAAMATASAMRGLAPSASFGGPRTRCGKGAPMADFAELKIGNKTIELPIVRRQRGRARDRHQQAAREDRLHHARPGLRQHRLVPQRDHVHRRREGHPALPRLSRSRSSPRRARSSRSPTC